MSPLIRSEEEPFQVGTSSLSMFLNRPCKLEWGLIFVCTRGKAVLSTEILCYDIRENTKVTLLPGTIVTLQQASPGFRVTFISFSVGLFEEANYRLEPSFSEFLRENPVYHVPEDKLSRMMLPFTYLKNIFHEHENRFRYEMVRNQLQCMFWDTYDKTYRLFEHKKNNTSYFHYLELFRKFISLIHKYYREEREVAFYAEKLCITPRYLSIIVRHTTVNKTPKDLINSHIILEIKVLLQSTQLSMQEIASQLNFPDQSYLGRYFRRYTGKSLSEYRASLNA